jgi:hypothetical protein
MGKMSCACEYNRVSTEVCLRQVCRLKKIDRGLATELQGSKKSKGAAHIIKLSFLSVVDTQCAPAVQFFRSRSYTIVDFAESLGQ